MNSNRYIGAMTAAAILFSWSTFAISETGAKVADQLGGPKLTRFGAEKSGTKDGNVPPYNGGVEKIKIPSSYKPGSGRWIDPFSKEKPLYILSSKNIEAHKGFLTPGAKEILEKYADFTIPVYKSHRTASYPNWVLDNIKKNQKTAHLTANGLGVAGAHGGIPFPIPKNGSQALWDFYLRWQSVHTVRHSRAYTSIAGGGATFSEFKYDSIFPYYNPNGNSEKMPRYFKIQKTTILKPASIAGTLNLQNFPIDYNKHDKLVYAYNPGTRRVQIAPQFAFDTPVSFVSGAVNWDQQNGYSGNPKQYNFKLLGKKEKIIPYNDYRMCSTTSSKTLINMNNSRYPNPHVGRWEIHRVWIVDATLKSNARNVVAERRMYFDEDTWQLEEVDNIDHSGKIESVTLLYPYITYGKTPALLKCYSNINFNKGTYMMANFTGTKGGSYTVSQKMPNMSEYGPQALAREGVR